MKQKLINAGINTGSFSLALLLLAFNAQFSTASAQGTGFTYQGRLSQNGAAANGSFDFRFRVASDALANNYAGSSVLTNGLPVVNGLFTVVLDFGAGIFNGSNYWLEVDVRTNGGGSYANLNPLQAVTPSPYAMFANTASNLSGTISSANVSGAYTGAVTFNNNGNNFSGSFNGNGSGVTNVNAAALGGLSANQFWKTTGNSNTVAGANFLGTADNQPLELSVNSQRVMRLEPSTNSPNLIGGFRGNYVTNGATGAFIGGGGAAVVFGSNGLNRVMDDFGVVSGGADNRAGNTNANPTDAYYATVGGGLHNTAEGIAASIGGGAENRAANNYGTIAGGYQNTNSGNSSAIGGGQRNSIGAQGDQSTIGGGNGNQVTSFYSVIAGGYLNTNTASYSSIGGGRLNVVSDSINATVGGGYANSILSAGNQATIGGGWQNSILTNAQNATIGGGVFNLVQNAANSATIGGGDSNHGGGYTATVPGGYHNVALADYSFAAGTVAQANHYGAFVWSDASSFTPFASTTAHQFAVRANGGVRFETAGAGMTLDGQAVATANAASLTSGTLPDARLSSNVPLLNQNQTFTGQNTFNNTLLTGDLRLEAANATYHHLELSGGNATGYLYGSFPNPNLGDGIHMGYNWYSDANGAGHVSNVGGQTSRISVGYTDIVMAFGGVNATPTVVRLDATLSGVTVYGTFNNFSDRNAKQDFAPVSSSQILERVMQVPVSEWSYKEDSATRHIGPMAQDFYSAFNIGTDDRHIAPIDEGGVALAAIQGLNQKVDSENAQLREELNRRHAENTELTRRLETLEKIVRNLKSN